MPMPDIVGSIQDKIAEFHRLCRSLPRPDELVNTSFCVNWLQKLLEKQAASPNSRKRLVALGTLIRFWTGPDVSDSIKAILTDMPSSFWENIFIRTYYEIMSITEKACYVCEHHETPIDANAIKLMPIQVAEDRDEIESTLIILKLADLHEYTKLLERDLQALDKRCCDAVGFMAGTQYPFNLHTLDYLNAVNQRRPTVWWGVLGDQFVGSKQPA